MSEQLLTGMSQRAISTSPRQHGWHFTRAHCALSDSSRVKKLAHPAFVSSRNSTVFTVSKLLVRRSLEFCQFQGLPEAILSCLLPVLPRFWSSVCLSFLTWGMLVWVSSGVVSVTQHLATPEATMQEFFISIYWLQTHMLNLLSLTLQPLSVNTLSPNIVPRRFLWLSCLLCWPLTQKSCLFCF